MWHLMLEYRTISRTRAVVQGAAAGAPAGAEVRKGLEVDLWSDLCLGHDLFPGLGPGPGPDPDQHHQSSLPGQDHHDHHDQHLHDHHARFCLVVVVDFLRMHADLRNSSTILGSIGIMIEGI
ncbi:hypothetical protein L195_g026205 [Trifolium pratense]|uniref:Uncharacterized protein n=1 Tax=Trifolium pratense TaxID=57577 RepID=A0A2K3NIM0_TRIPR|nr:hypothetical protein L195_g026205 [Trifolium pratense]